MEGGIYIQEVIIQGKKIIERGSIDICEEMIGTKYTHGTIQHSNPQKKWQIVIKVNVMPTQHMVFG